MLQSQAPHLLIPILPASLSDRVPLTLSNASNASFSSAFSKLAKSEDIISPCYLSASPDKVEVEVSSPLLLLLKQNCHVRSKIFAKLEGRINIFGEPELATFTDYSSVTFNINP